MPCLIESYRDAEINSSYIPGIVPYISKDNFCYMGHLNNKEPSQDEKYEILARWHFDQRQNLS